MGLDDSEDKSGVLTWDYDYSLIFGAFIASFLIAFSLTLIGYIVYFCLNLRLRSNRTIVANPTYIALDPLKYSHIFAEDSSGDGTNYPYTIRKKLY